MKQKVLIIDDEKDLCLLMRAYLLPLNYEVHLAFTLKEGLQKMHEVMPDVLFLDNNLPDGLGWSKVHQFKALLPGIKINLMSAYTHPTQEMKTVLSVRFLEKPISLRSLKNYL